MQYNITEDHVRDYVKKKTIHFQWRTREGEIFNAWVKDLNIHYKSQNGRERTIPQDRLKKFVDAWNELGRKAPISEYQVYTYGDSGVNYLPVIMDKCSTYYSKGKPTSQGGLKEFQLKQKTDRLDFKRIIVDKKSESLRNDVLSECDLNPTRHTIRTEMICRDSALVSKTMKSHDNKCLVCGRHANIEIKNIYEIERKTYFICSHCNGNILKGCLDQYDKWRILEKASKLFDEEKYIHRPYIIHAVRGKYTLQDAKEKSRTKKQQGDKVDIYDVGKRLPGSFQSRK